MPGNAMIGNLAVNLSLETAAFQRGATIAEKRAQAMSQRFSAATKSFVGLGAVLGVGIGITALTGIAKNAFDMASALDESAQKMGVTVEALQELNLAAEQSGVSQESLAGAMAKLNKNMGMLQQGSAPAVKAFAALGLAAEDLKGKSPDEALRIIADRLNALPDVQQRVAVGAQLMGRGFSELLPLINGGSKALDDYANKSRAQGEVTTEEAKRLDELADSWDRLKVRSGVAAAKIIAMFVDLADKGDAWTARWYASRDRFLASIEQMSTRAVAYVEGMVEGIAGWFRGKLSATLDWAKQKVDSVTNAFKSMWDKVVGHSYVPDMITGIAQEFGRLGQIMVDPTISATDKVGAAFQSLQSVIGQVLGRKAGGIFSMIASIGQAFAPLLGSLFGGGLGKSAYPVVGGVDPLAPLPGFARGGSMRLGGFGGVDKNLISMNGSPIARASRGETLAISRDGSSSPTINQYFSPNFAGNAATMEDLQRMALITKTATMQAIQEKGRRRAR